MPWCPKCKTEYREGFTVCADCGSELVKERPVGKRNSSFWGAEPEEQAAEQAAHEEVQEPEQAAVLSEMAKQAQAKQAQKRRGGAYRDSSEQASDNRSSGWILLILGIVGLAAVILGVLGFLPVSIGNKYLFYGVMGAVFVLFLVSGIVSMKNAKFFDKKAETENSLKNALLEWCRDNLDAAEIDGKTGASGASDEVRYFKRTSYVKAKLNHQFVNLDQGFLERLIDDSIYDMVFGDESK